MFPESQIAEVLDPVGGAGQSVFVLHRRRHIDRPSPNRKQFAYGPHSASPMQRLYAEVAGQRTAPIESQPALGSFRG